MTNRQAYRSKERIQLRELPCFIADPNKINLNDFKHSRPGSLIRCHDAKEITMIPYRFMAKLTGGRYGATSQLANVGT